MVEFGVYPKLLVGFKTFDQLREHMTLTSVLIKKEQRYKKD